MPACSMTGSFPEAASWWSSTKWENEEQFRSFFDGNPKVAVIMASVGITRPPEITVFGSIDAPGNV
jgi:hypothetical protein